MAHRLLRLIIMMRINNYYSRVCAAVDTLDTEICFVFCRALRFTHTLVGQLMYGLYGALLLIQI